jgi:hypothetical protein
VFWIVLAKTWRHWRDALVLVQPDTVVRWHREWLRWRWTKVSRRRRAGRPTIDREIHALIRDMTTANPLWGAPRIHGELRKLGIDVSERTVSRLMAHHRRPPSQTWRTFLTNQFALTASMDFFTVPTLTGRVLFVLVILSHERRRVVHRVARRQRHVPSLRVESTQRLREYARLALHVDGLPRFSRAPTQLGVHNDARSTASTSSRVRPPVAPDDVLANDSLPNPSRLTHFHVPDHRIDFA